MTPLGRFLSAVLLATVATVTWGLAAGPAADRAPSAPIRIPSAPVPPAPPPLPGGATALAADQWYVIDSDVECLVLASPDGIVKVSAETGPFKVRGRFVDGINGGAGIETRTYKGKYVYTVEASAKGRCELLVVPVGDKGAGVIRRTLDVMGAEPPKPPDPKPDDPPKPPVPPPDALKSFRVIFVYESADNLSPDARGVVYGRVVEEWMTANCTGGKAGWRRRDKDTPGEADATMAALWAAVKPAITVTPCCVMERNGKVEIVNLEATPAKMVEKLQTYRGK